ncbi:glycosyltransferase family 9 protein [Cumulibacter manganitolerans]|uniref:glycosyltransferase family 9 protein n=1 Tax=Cumulibacter manganitolerans TaxID=1884992 RepID=UPI001296A7C9|nr:glycosyltransferase family 9 protein [Cumulibacter manganitolerans]
MSGTLAVRLDSDGDVLLTGPAIRALARLGPVDLLASPEGAAAGRLLPGVEDVRVFAAPWSGFRPPPVDRVAVDTLVDDLARRCYDRAVLFTSFHQSPLPMALLCRMAGIPHIVGTSTDYPGSLLDVRHKRPDPPAGGHEVDAALELAMLAGAPAPRPEDRRLQVRRPLPPPPEAVRSVLSRSAEPRAVVLHPGASVTSRSLRAQHAAAIAAVLADAGHPVLVTGGPGERALAAEIVALSSERSRGCVIDLAGQTSLAELAATLADAGCVIVGNTGPAHLAAAVGTPVVSLFSPVVPVERWRPYGVPCEVLGDQHARCRDTRARDCPVPGHPCLSSVSAVEVLAAVRRLLTSSRQEV